jgi:hypothetical protein
MARHRHRLVAGDTALHRDLVKYSAELEQAIEDLRKSGAVPLSDDED